MFTMNYRLIIFILTVSLLGTGCADDGVYQTGTVTPNSGITSQKNFSLLFSEVDPIVVDPTTGVFSQTTIEVTVFIGDRNNQQITAARVIYFQSEYGLIEPSCTTNSTGSCSVSLQFTVRPGPLPVGGGDGYTTIVAYTVGEESYTETNGNGIFDDLDVGGVFVDREEPYIDLELRSGLGGDGIFDGFDVVIDTVNGNDLTGINGVHDIADSFFNGGGCTHSSLCSATVRSPTIWVASANGLTGPPLAPVATYTVGGNVTGTIFPAGALDLLNNGGDTINMTGLGTFTFTTTLADLAAYAITVANNTTTLTCVITGGGNGDGAGAIATANVTNIDVACN